MYTGTLTQVPEKHVRSQFYPCLTLSAPNMTNNVMPNSHKLYPYFPFKQFLRISLFILDSLQFVTNSYIFTTKQLILYWHCKEKIDVDKRAGQLKELNLILYMYLPTCMPLSVSIPHVIHKGGGEWQGFDLEPSKINYCQILGNGETNSCQTKYSKNNVNPSSPKLDLWFVNFLNSLKPVFMFFF